MELSAHCQRNVRGVALVGNKSADFFAHDDGAEVVLAEDVADGWDRYAFRRFV